MFGLTPKKLFEVAADAVDALVDGLTLGEYGFEAATPRDRPVQVCEVRNRSGYRDYALDGQPAKASA